VLAPEGVAAEVLAPEGAAAEELAPQGSLAWLFSGSLSIPGDMGNMSMDLGSLELAGLPGPQRPRLRAPSAQLCT
jgi:hypothetical protein